MTAEDFAGNKAEPAFFTVRVLPLGLPTGEGEVTIKVVSDVSDGTFTFSSSDEPKFNRSVTTVDGKGDFLVSGLDPGKYVVTANLPDGSG